MNDYDFAIRQAASILRTERIRQRKITIADRFTVVSLIRYLARDARQKLAASQVAALTSHGHLSLLRDTATDRGDVAERQGAFQ
jgi:hypothetical protein